MREEAEFPRTGHGVRAGLITAHIYVLIPPDVHGEHVSCLQPAPGTLFAEHDADQFQGHRQGDLGPVVVAGEVSWEKLAETMSLDGWLGTEVDDSGDGGFTDLQPVEPAASAKSDGCRTSPPPSPDGRDPRP